MGEILFKGNDNILELDGLKNDATGAYINNATCDVTLVDKNGTNVVGGSWPLTMDYVAASSGRYRATLADTLTVNVEERLTAKINANGGGGLKGYWELPVWSKIREDI